ncbi:MAG TPA: flagellar basal body P-ring protein FlgI [Nevskia sp.]|nr:flagellar basal body P-ring protein FlgI [Nevskia sp.]
MRILVALLAAVAATGAAAANPSPPAALAVKVRDLAHVQGVRDNQLVGYGIVAGLAGTGDSQRSSATLQSISNTLARFGVRVTPDQISSRNVAAVMITATLPAFASSGDKLDVNVASLGDARSLTGGTLMLAPLKGPDDKVYALAQGPLSVGGFRYDAFGNLLEKNHPTVGQIPGGAIIEADVATSVVSKAGTVYVVLDNPNYVTADRIADALSAALPPMPDARVHRVQAVDAGRVLVRLTADDQAQLVKVLATIEATAIVPDDEARIVVNERTGTVVSGGDVRLGQVSVAQGDLKVEIATDYAVSQPVVIGRAGPGVRSVVVPETQIKADESSNAAVSLPAGTTVADLVAALNRLKVAPRDTISILQAIRRAGSLHAQLIIQ